jgi:hypothetical protein
MLWVTSFVDSGHLESDDDAKKIYQNLLLISVAATCCMTPVVWLAIDKVHLPKMMVLLFGMRALTCLFGYTNLD